jgi:Co/Zn/Cd efflux system component
MGNEHHQRRTPLDADRAAEAQRATWVSVAVNLVLTVAQIVVGWLAHSQSLIAHGLHSFSDLLSDFLVIYASRQSAHPADEAHPYGHARVETAATLVLGLIAGRLIGGASCGSPGCACSSIENAARVVASGRRCGWPSHRFPRRACIAT